MQPYHYRCTACGHDLEATQKFSDPSLTVCPNCEGLLRKVFNAVGVVFKGSGFYRTDSRKAGTNGDGSGSGDSGPTKKSNGDAKPDKKESSTPVGAGKSDGAKTTVSAGTSSTGSRDSS